MVESNDEPSDNSNADRIARRLGIQISGKSGESVWGERSERRKRHHLRSRFKQRVGRKKRISERMADWLKSTIVSGRNINENNRNNETCRCLAYVRATSSQLTGKSQSQREISRSRGDKREVSFVEPAPRSRSLTREEAGTDGRSRFGGRSSSAQRLSMERPSRADSRVTFGPDTTIHVERTVPPVPPARSRDHSKYENRSENHTIRQDVSSVKTNESQVQSIERFLQR